MQVIITHAKQMVPHDNLAPQTLKVSLHILVAAVTPLLCKVKALKCSKPERVSDCNVSARAKGKCCHAHFNVAFDSLRPVAGRYASCFLQVLHIISFVFASVAGVVFYALVACRIISTVRDQEDHQCPHDFFTILSDHL